MAVQPVNLYTNGLQAILNGTIPLIGQTYNMILLNGSYNPSPNSDAHYSDVSGFELVSGNGYTVGGVALSGPATAIGGSLVTFSTGSATWNAPFSAGPFRYAACVHVASGSVPAASDLLLFFDDVTGGGNVLGNGSQFQIQCPAGGWFSVAHNP